jgi:hypothetical protein
MLETNPKSLSSVSMASKIIHDNRRYSTLETLKERLLSSSSSNSEKPFSSYEFGVDKRTGREYFKIGDVNGNNLQFLC